ncbi:uncharacterized protein J4E88_002456 [Alternaria novae-zelandiae]|uniref:uncharacterized protein n=1 Tax=Alternaria novae-zelandiae TaxID=430562 RepID=UPI0020C389F0|nr:uncharacterized protein J4E88_002456 [Alternaria novae-zelandiae]KAI4690982.1 hypothetical protein J4E88_002456 [Alternaria novae-zelandiae]
MFPSVKDRARQLFGEAAVPDAAPPPPVATGRRGAPLKASAATKAAPEPKTPAKTSRSKKDAPVVEETPKAIGAWPSPFDSFKARTSPPEKPTPPTPSKSKSSKTATASKPSAPSKTSTPSASKPEKSSKAEKSEKSKSEKAEKSSKSEKKSSSRPKTPPTPKAAAPPKKAPEPKVSTPSRKKTESKPAPKPKEPSRPKLDARTSSSRPKMERTSSSSSLEDDEYSDLRAACLREASNVTGLKGKNLAISLRQRSSGGWYAALKDVGADKYLKMWMNRDKTFKTQDEALEAYLVFVKKMNTDMKLFGPMSPKLGSGKSKGFF